MGILSTSTAVTRYRVNGKPDQPVYEFIGKALTANAIPEIDERVSGKVVGWTSFENPYRADFKGSNFVYGAYFVFSLRIDRKVLSQKVVQKYIALETEKRLKQSGREYLSADEKKTIKDHVINLLNLRIPATPNIYNVMWNPDQETLLYFTALKAANEELETLFLKSFQLSLTRLFPYTLADLQAGLSDSQKDRLAKLSPSEFEVIG
jgi:DNA recombination-dependent growth factor C